MAINKNKRKNIDEKTTVENIDEQTTLERRMLERTSPLNYVTLEGLSLQTGCDSSDLDLFVLKELVDNALDACEGASNPVVEVKIETKDQFMTIIVKDNGKGISEEDIKKIADFERAYSTKFHYKYSTRGALGNAVKCVLGIPHALASELRIELPTTPIIIRSKGKEYSIDLNIQEVEEQVKSEVSVRNQNKGAFGANLVSLVSLLL